MPTGIKATSPASLITVMELQVNFSQSLTNTDILTLLGASGLFLACFSRLDLPHRVSLVVLPLDDVVGAAGAETPSRLLNS